MRTDHHCGRCGFSTVHRVTIEFESTATRGIIPGHAKYARRPVRVLLCTECGAETR